MSISNGSGPLNGIQLFCLYFVGAFCLPLFELVRISDFLGGTKLPSVWHSLIYASFFLVLVGIYAFSFLLSGTLLLDCVYGLIVMRRINDWVLSIPCSKYSLDSDEFFYSPTGKYTGKFFEHRNETIGDWVYAQSID